MAKKTARKPKIKSPGMISSRIVLPKKKKTKKLTTKKGGPEKPTYMSTGGKRAGTSMTKTKVKMPRYTKTITKRTTTKKK